MIPIVPKHREGNRPVGLLVRFALIASVLLAAAFFASCASKPKGPSPIPAQAGPAAFRTDASGVSPDPLLAPTDEELWILSRSISDSRPRGEESPGTGAMLARIPQEPREIPLPLEHTEVKALVSGFIATVEVTQQFQNPYDARIEAVYVFPLPHNASVNEFVMTIGERRIRGIIRERREAKRIYQEAKERGYVASLLAEERPNIFTQSVANIEPGRAIDVHIKYFHTLDFVDGWYEFVFPMVVGPRFNPPGTATGVGAVARAQRGVSGQPTEAQYLPPEERSGQDISLTLEVNAGLAIEESVCGTHSVWKEDVSPGRFVARLNSADRIPNRDFVLRYRVAGEPIKSSLLACRDERGGYFTLMLYPPRDLKDVGRQPLELVFVLDCSGSMSGRPLEQAKAAIEHALHRLESGDVYQIIRFSDHASSLGPRPLPISPENVRRGLAYLRSLESEGGTMMIEGIKAALDSPHDPERLRFVCFLTDGYIGNEKEILGEVHQRLGATRIFSLGVGSSVNRYLLDHLAKLGRGAVAYLGLNDDGAKVMDDFLERISHPALSDLRIDWGAMYVTEVFPLRLPDLFVDRPVVVTGRFTGDPAPDVRVIGTAGGRPMELTVPAQLDDAAATHKGLPAVWARMKIADLEDRMSYDANGKLPRQIKQVALDYGLMSAFTAFVAVDSTRRTKGTGAATVPVAVTVPEGVNYETTVSGEK